MALLKLHDTRLSGNAWKVRLLLSHLHVPFTRVTYVLAEGKTYLPEFRKMNPLGKVPVVEFEDGVCLYESNAILAHFAEGTAYLPADPLTRTRVFQWLFFEQAELMPNVAIPRMYIMIKKEKERYAREIDVHQAAATRALGVMDAQLERTRYLAGDEYTIADISLHAYASLAPDAEIDLSDFSSVRRWSEDVQRQPGYVPLLES